MVGLEPKLCNDESVAEQVTACLSLELYKHTVSRNLISIVKLLLKLSMRCTYLKRKLITS